MPDSLPPVTPAQRQRLQKLWEEARGLIARASSWPGRKEAEKIHELLAECVAGDPGNTIYLDALLVHLRSLRQIAKSRWWPFRSSAAARGSGDQSELLSPQILRGLLRDLPNLSDDDYRRILGVLATSCSLRDLPEAEIRYLRESLNFFSDDARMLQQLAHALMTQGRFDEARSVATRLKELAGDSTEAAHLLMILEGSMTSFAPQKELLSRSESRHSAADFLVLAAEHVEHRQFDEAEAAAAKALSLSGGDLAIREQVEDISLARLKGNVAIARRLVEHEPSEPHRQTLRRWEDELGRLELATLNARSERFPQDAGLKLEVAVRLRRAGNYSGAIQRLDEIAADSSLRLSVLIELGECWQHLRQFEKALGYYSQAVSAADTASPSDPLHLALYRAGTLAAAMQRIPEAQAPLQRLVSLAPDYKDAQERLRALS